MAKNPVVKAYSHLQKEQKTQVAIVYPSAVVVLWGTFGFRNKRIARVLAESQNVVDECAALGGVKSIIEVLDDETGIELTLPGMESYQQYASLYSEKWKGVKEHLSAPEVIYLYKRMELWIPSQMIASLSVALHRTEGFGFERLQKFISEVDAIRNQYGRDTKKYKELIREKTDIDPEILDFW